MWEGNSITFWRTRESVSNYNREAQVAFQTPESWKCEIPAPGKWEQHQGVTRRWVDAILKGSEPVARGEEGIKSLEISNAMLLSAWTDSWVDIPVDEEVYLKTLEERVATSKFQKKAGPGGTLNMNASW